MRVGITGTMGSGKSSVSCILKDMKYNVLDLDSLVHTYYEQGGSLYVWLKANIPPHAFDDSGSIVRKKLAKLIFEHDALREQLESQVFSLVRKDIIQYFNTQKEPVLFVEAPLLFEAKLEDLFDTIIVVDAPQNVRYDRLLKRGLTHQDIRNREHRQLSSDEKKQRAHYVINNDGSMDDLVQEVKKMMEDLIRWKNK